VLVRKHGSDSFAAGQPPQENTKIHGPNWFCDSKECRWALRGAASADAFGEVREIDDRGSGEGKLDAIAADGSRWYERTMTELWRRFSFYLGL
jgi:hypothetical protein